MNESKNKLNKLNDKKVNYKFSNSGIEKADKISKMTIAIASIIVF